MKKLFKPVLDFLESVLSVKEVKKKYSDLILINEEGEILLLLRSNTDSFCPGQWSLPGGSIEEGEHPSISALRELKEETGIELNVDDIQFYKEIDRGNNISYYFIGSASISDVEIILDANEHQGYEWVSPNNIWQKDCLMDLSKFLAESFNVSSSSEKYVDQLANYSTEDQIIEAVSILNKSFDNGEINEDKYLDKINLLGIIKSEYDKSIITGKNNDPDYTVRIKKANINNELDNNYQNYLDNAYFYNDKLYDENGIGIPMTSEDIQNIIKQNKTIYQVDCQKLDSFVSGSKIFEDTKRYEFEKILPTIKKYNDYYNKYENELLDSFSSSINDYQNRRSEIKKTIKSTIGNGLSDSKNIIKLLEFIKSNLNDEIDPLFNIRYQYDSDTVNKRQIFLSELEKFLNDGGFIDLTSLEVVGIDSYDDGEFSVDYFDVNDIKNISIIHDRVLNKVKPLTDLKLELDDKLNKGEITDEEFLSYIIKADDASHGGKLVKKQVIDKTGRKQTKWVSKNGEEEKKEVKNEYTDDELVNHAKNSSLADLERVIKESPDSKLRELAHSEISRREKEEHVNDDSDSNNKSPEKSNKDDTDNTTTKKDLNSVLDELKNEYKNVVQEVMDDDFEDEKKTKDLLKQQSLLSYYSSKLKTKFMNLDKDSEINKAISKFNFKNENDIKKFFGDGNILGLSVQGNNIQAVTEDMYCSRTFDKKNNRIIADEFILNPLLEKGSGIGTKIFSSQVKEFKNQGFKEIKTLASKTGDLNGYYTWARLGYDFANDYESEALLDIVEGHENENIANVKSLPELMSFEEGRDFWRENGWSFDAKFDLSDDSASMFILNNYMKERKNGK